MSIHLGFFCPMVIDETLQKKINWMENKYKKIKK